LANGSSNPSLLPSPETPALGYARPLTKKSLNQLRITNAIAKREGFTVGAAAIRRQPRRASGARRRDLNFRFQLSKQA
jgi:hypothetical protein